MDETKNPVDNDQKGNDKRSKGGGSKVVPKTKTECIDQTSLNPETVRLTYLEMSSINKEWNKYQYNELWSHANRCKKY